MCDCYLIDSCCYRGGRMVWYCGGGAATGRGCGCYHRGGAAAATGAVGRLLLWERLLPAGGRWLLLRGELQPAGGRLLLRGWALPGCWLQIQGGAAATGARGGGCYRGGGCGFRAGGAGCCCEGATAIGRACRCSGGGADCCCE